MQIDLLPGGTERGYGFWTRWLGCERKAYYAMNETRIGGLNGSLATDIGIIMHEYQALYYQPPPPITDGRALRTSEIIFVDPAEPPASYIEQCVVEANRAFQAYRRHHPPDELGRVVEVEQTHRVKDFLGGAVPAFDIKPDLVVEMVEEREVLWGGERTVLQPGYYIVDHKTLKTEGPDDALFYRHDLRFPAYMLAWNELYPERECQGLIANCTYYGYRKVSFKRYVVKPPSLVERLQVSALLKRCYEAYASAQAVPAALKALKVPCRATFCKDRFGHMCPYISHCMRY